MLDFINEQPIAVKILSNSVKNKKISHAYLFETNNYENSKKIIYSFIKEILCVDKNNCKNCQQCENIDNGLYPEIKEINSDGLWIKKDQLLDLQMEFSTKPVLGNKKIYIINEAAKLNPASANSILKFLEEPEENIIAILITDNRYKVINTILSRCQIISFKNNTYEIDENEKNEEYLEAINKFVLYYENNHIDTLLNIKNLWFDTFTNKEQMIIGLDLLILYYKELIDLKCNKKIINFVKYEDKMTKIIEKLSINNICNKIKIIIKQKELIYSNINSNLLMDKLIILFSEGEL